MIEELRLMEKNESERERRFQEKVGENEAQKREMEELLAILKAELGAVKADALLKSKDVRCFPLIG